MSTTHFLGSLRQIALPIASDNVVKKPKLK
jgi:hypothetical protein